MIHSEIEMFELIAARAKEDAGYAIAYAILLHTEAVSQLGNTSTSMGALEALGLIIEDASKRLADAISGDI
jgi:hypothetical protein